ncbi:L,D-transpeptidase [Tianweitania sediminis]|jgi:lipoprotein-anchoring transpeptidase ErfK/SrfK|uniref:L,D-transpeptidase n=1 Tax=Tianweitania sediminis TaxID=1502156 RepID=A0A8J7UHM1_9HYPH|nr:L,D-transpeptidase [Tianweitania sediminis]MBP0439339.1 L,D-transpeptidase [Tianweitania sediminis]HEV7415916.1 L,D-transpeptidase [Tianweitania sediminis]
MRNLLSSLLLGATLLLGWSASQASAASIVADVSLSSQTMTVSRSGRVLYTWKVSTAGAKKVTPTGSWSAKHLSKNHRSSRYNNAPMPYAIFYNGHYAVHGTDQISRLGRPASKGCIRLHPKNAAVLFDMVKKEGLRNTRITVRR